MADAKLKINFVDFCHDSAKRASPMALAAPKVLRIAKRHSRAEK